MFFWPDLVCQGCAPEGALVWCLDPLQDLTGAGLVVAQALGQHHILSPDLQHQQSRLRQ